ncbi:hypothetical protein Thermus77412_11560 [Thermus antranikianii]
MRRFLIGLGLMGVLWVFQPGLAGDAPLQAQHEVGIRIPVILRLEVVELGLRMEALPQGRLTLGPGSYRLRIVSNTRWRLWLVPLLENPSSEASSFLLEGRGREEVTLQVPPGATWEVWVRVGGG